MFNTRKPSKPSQPSRPRTGIRPVIRSLKYYLRRTSTRLFGYPRRSVLFICTGNTCRSAMAEYIAKATRPGWRVASAGSSTGNGSPATQNAVTEIISRYDDRRIEQHQSTSLRFVDPYDYDTVVVFNGTPVDHPDVRNTYLTDPYGGSQETYSRTASEIVAIIRNL